MKFTVYSKGFNWVIIGLSYGLVPNMTQFIDAYVRHSAFGS